jgi:hypothetical protein
MFPKLVRRTIHSSIAARQTQVRNLSTKAACDTKLTGYLHSSRNKPVSLLREYGLQKLVESLNPYCVGASNIYKIFNTVSILGVIARGNAKNPRAGIDQSCHSKTHWRRQSFLEHGRSQPISHCRRMPQL